ncbi:TPA: hypothetical protein ACN35C_004797 [Vibrio parahaemolyticus]
MSKIENWAESFIDKASPILSKLNKDHFLHLENSEEIIIKELCKEQKEILYANKHNSDYKEDISIQFAIESIAEAILDYPVEDAVKSLERALEGYNPKADYVSIPDNVSLYNKLISVENDNIYLSHMNFHKKTALNNLISQCSGYSDNGELVNSDNPKHKTFMPRNQDLQYFLGTLAEKRHVLKCNGSNIGTAFFLSEKCETQSLNYDIYENKKNGALILSIGSGLSESNLNVELSHSNVLTQNKDDLKEKYGDNLKKIRVSGEAERKRLPVMKEGRCELVSNVELECEYDKLLDIKDLPEGTEKEVLKRLIVKTEKEVFYQKPLIEELFVSSMNNEVKVLEMEQDLFVLNFGETLPIDYSDEYKVLELNDKAFLVNNKNDLLMENEKPVVLSKFEYEPIVSASLKNEVSDILSEVKDRINSEKEKPENKNKSSRRNKLN